MRILRSLGAAAVLAATTVGGLTVLLLYARPQALLGLSWRELLLQPDDGRLLTAVLSVVAWVAWLGWMALLTIDVGARLRGTSWRVAGLGWAQAVVATLIVALLAAQRPLPAAHAEAPRPVPVVHVHEVRPSIPAPEESAAQMATSTDARGRYEVQPGDDLWSLAQRLLGDGLQWRAIAEANPQVVDPAHIEPGWELVIPGWQGSGAVEVPPAPEVPAQESPGAPRPEPAPAAQAEPDFDVPPVVETDEQVETADQVGAARPAAVAPETAPIESSADVLPYVGVGSLVAAGVVAGLRLRRDRQSFQRPAGRRYDGPDAASARLESVLRATRDDDGAALLEAALRRIGQHCRDRVLPELDFAEVGPVEITLHFAADPGQAPEGFEHEQRSWTLPRKAWDGQIGSAPLAYPAIIPVGSREGVTVLVDLERAGILGVAGDDGPDVVAALAVAAAASPWALEVELVTTEMLRELVTAAEVEVTVVEEATDAVVTRPFPLDLRTARLDPDRSASLAPRLAFVDEQLARLQPSPGLGVVMPSDAAPWRIDVAAGQLVTPQVSIPLEPLRLPAAEREGLARLYASATTDETSFAPWWDSSPEPFATPATRPGIPSRQESSVSDPPAHPLVLLLGPIELAGCTGPAPSRATRQCVEYAAWLLEHPGGTATQMADALFVAEGTRRSNMSRLRGWLGRDADGEPYLPEAYCKRIELHPAVASDWQQLQALVAPGVNRVGAQTLQAALSLVRGAPLADAAPGQWHWAEPMRSDMVAVIRDVGVQLAELALAAGDVETARWATARALVAAPEDELLLAARIRAEASVGNRAEVDRLTWRLTRQARTLGVELRDDTVRLLQEVVEGHVRARAVS